MDGRKASILTETFYRSESNKCSCGVISGEAKSLGVRAHATATATTHSLIHAFTHPRIYASTHQSTNPPIQHKSTEPFNTPDNDKPPTAHRRLPASITCQLTICNQCQVEPRAHCSPYCCCWFWRCFPRRWSLACSLSNGNGGSHQPPMAEWQNDRIAEGHAHQAQTQAQARPDQTRPGRQAGRQGLPARPPARRLPGNLTAVKLATKSLSLSLPARTHTRLRRLDCNQ